MSTNKTKGTRRVAGANFPPHLISAARIASQASGDTLNGWLEKCMIHLLNMIESETEEYVPEFLKDSYRAVKTFKKKRAKAGYGPKSRIIAIYFAAETYKRLDKAAELLCWSRNRLSSEILGVCVKFIECGKFYVPDMVIMARAARANQAIPKELR